MSENKKALALTLPTDEKGLVQTKNIEEMLHYGDFLLRSGMLPKSYKSASQVVAAMQMAAETGMTPGLKTIAKTASINGVPSFFGEMPLAICQSRGEVEDMEGFYFDDQFRRICMENQNLDKDVFGYKFRIKRKGQPTYHEEHYTIAQAKKAGLYSKSHSVWAVHPEDMLRNRTVGKALKFVFADILNGAPIAEYDYNTMPTIDKPIAKANIDGVVESEINDRLKEEGAIVEAEVVEPEIVDKLEEKVIDEKQEAKEEIKEPENETVREVVEEKKEEVEPPVQPENDLEYRLAQEGAAIQEEGNNKKAEIIGNYIISLGQYKGKQISDLRIDEVAILSKKVKEHLGENPDDKTSKELSLKLCQYIAQEM